MHVRIDQLEQRMDKKIIEHEQRICDNEKQIALIFSKLQIFRLDRFIFYKTADDADDADFTRIKF